jgi:hypothetical protein
MRVVAWDAERVSTSDSVAVPAAPSGADLRDRFIEAVRTFTLGIAGVHGNSVVIGPIELLRFGTPKVNRNAVDWPIEGGVLAGRAGGHWRIGAEDGRVEATVSGYAPSLPRHLYTLTQLQVHQLFTRLYLLRLRGRDPLPGVPVTSRDRTRAAMVDAAFCLTLAGLTGRRRVRRTLAIAVAYHVACWSISGQTLGGLVMKQRVVAFDGSRLTAAQSLLRFVVLPLSWVTRAPVHDRIACTEVVADQIKRGGQ